VTTSCPPTDCHPRRSAPAPNGLRPLLIGSLLCAFVGVAFPYGNLVVRGTRPANTSLPFGVVAVFFVVVLANRALRRWRLRRDELLVVFVMLLIAAAVPTWGMVGQLLPIMTGVFYYASPENKWEDLLHPHLPDWFAPHGEETIRYFYEGAPAGWKVPWGEWVGPLLAWAGLIAAFYVVSTCLMLLLRRQWVEQEHLIYPLMRLPVEMVEEDPRGEAPFWRNRLMWAGFAGVAGATTINALHGYFPVVPLLPLRADLPIRVAQELVVARFWLNFSVVGFAYLINAQVAFSLWFFCLVTSWQSPLMRLAGLNTGPHEIYCADTPVVSYQAFGGMLVMVGLGLWNAREDLARVMGWRPAVAEAGAVGRPPPSEGGGGDASVAGDRVALFLFVAGCVAIVAWLSASGLPVGAGVTFLTAALVMFVALTRGIVQGGVPISRAVLIPQSFTVYLLGTQRIGPAGLAALAGSFAWTADIRVFLMPFFAHALKVWHELRTRRRDLLAAVALALVVSFAGSVYVTILWAYRYGGLNLSAWLFDGNPRVAFTYASSLMQNPVNTEWWRFGWLAAGAVAMYGLTAANALFSWWPFHPLGFAIGPTQPVVDLWFSIFLGWLLKVLLLRYGGYRLYHRLTYVLLGAILGQFVACGFWTVIDALVGAKGHMLYVY